MESAQLIRLQQPATGVSSIQQASSVNQGGVCSEAGPASLPPCSSLKHILHGPSELPITCSWGLCSQQGSPLVSRSARLLHRSPVYARKYADCAFRRQQCRGLGHESGVHYAKSRNFPVVKGGMICAEASVPVGRRSLQHLIFHVQSKQLLLQRAAFGALVSAALVALKENFQTLTSGGGPSGGNGPGNPFWRWGDDSSGGRKGPDDGGFEVTGQHEEGSDDEESESRRRVAKRQLPFAHIGGGLQGIGHEPKGENGAEDGEEDVEDEEEGDLGTEEDGLQFDEEDGGETVRKSRTLAGVKRIYSDLPPGFEPDTSDVLDAVADKLAEREEVEVSPMSPSGAVSGRPAGFDETEVDGALQNPSSVPHPSGRGEGTMVVDLSPDIEEPTMTAAVPERRGGSPPQAVGNWFAGVFGALLGRRSGGPPASESELVTAQDTIQRVVEMMTSQQGDDALAMRGDINALRRLQRETFAQLLEMRDRLSKLEFHTGLRQTRGTAELPAFASHLSGTTKISGEVSVGLGLLTVEEDQSRQTKTRLDHAALRTGTDVRINLETPFRTTDLLMMQLAAGNMQGGGEGSVLSVKKVMYRAQLADWLCLRVAATGAQGADMAEALNPLEGQGLTALTSAGSALHRRCTGAAVAATARTTDWSWVTMGHFVSGWGPGSAPQEPLCHSTLGQLTLRPAPECALAVVALNRHWPAPSLPASSGLHWSEMGPLLLPRVKASSPQHPATNGDFVRDSYESSSSSMNGTGDVWSSLPQPRLRGHSLQSYGFAGAVAVGELATLSGWAHLDQTTTGGGPPPRRGVQWGATLSGAPDGPGVGWGLSAGCTQPEPWVHQADLRAGAGEYRGAQTQMEAFLNLTSGKSFTLTPGAVMIKEGNRVTGPAFMLRSAWAF